MKLQNTAKRNPMKGRRRSKMDGLTLMSAMFLSVVFFSCCGAAYSQDSSEQSKQPEQTTQSNAQVTAQAEPPGQAFEMIPDDGDKQDISSEVSIVHRMFGKSQFRDFAEHEITGTDIRKQPFLYFRHWARKRLPIVPSFLFLLFVSITSSACFSNRLEVAKSACRSSFWRCMGRAILTFSLMLIFARFLFMTVIGTPLALLMIAFAELIGVAGLAVGISLVGDGVCSRLGLNKPEWREQHPRQSRVFTSVVGTIIASLILLVPGIGSIPPIGTRIVMLIATLGAGGLLKTRFGRKSEA